jgi:hypothetical protein
LGKRYNVSASKLIRKWNKTTVEKENDAKSYFCSELVAAAYKLVINISYKDMKLLPEDISSASYWPGAFSQSSKTTLLKGQLQSELLLDFSIYERHSC